MAMRALTPKQRRWVDLYVVDLDPDKASRGVGFTPSYGRKLCTRVHIKRAIAARQKKAFEATGVTPEMVIEELGRWLMLDPIDIFNDDGSMKPLSEIPSHVRRSILGLEIEERNTRGGNKLRKLKLFPKERAAEMLGKHFKLFTEVHEIKSAQDLAEAVLAGRRQARRRRGSY